MTAAARRPMENWDIVRVAQAMIVQWGDDAAVLMERRAALHAEAGELEGARFWRRVGDAVRLIQDGRS